MPAELDPRTARLLPWIVAIAFFMQMLDGTILNTALPAMAATLNESPLRMQSVVIAYLLTVALLIPASGWIADRFGTRRVFFGAIFLFSLGSLLCAQAPSLDLLIMARVVQGLGGALMVPVGRLVVLRAYPRAQLVEVLSFVTLPGMVGPLVGPTLGGWLVEYASWHWIFLINIPVGVLGCVATWKFMPDIRAAAGAQSRFDAMGFVFFGAAMVLISVALEGLGELHLAHARVMLLLMAGLACLAAYWLHAARAEHPIFSLSLFHTHTYAVGVLGNLFARLGSGAMPFLMPLLLQVGLGYAPAKAGMTMIPVAACAMFAKALAKPLIERLGYRKLLTANTLLLGCLMASFASINASTPYVWLLAHLAIFGAINSLQFTAMNTVTLIDLSDSDASSGNSLLSVVMQLSVSLGVAAAAALLAGFANEYVHPTQGQLLESFHYTFICVGLMAMLAAGIFLQLPPLSGKPRTHTAAHQVGDHL